MTKPPYKTCLTTLLICGKMSVNKPSTPVPGESAVRHVGGFSLWI